MLNTCTCIYVRIPKPNNVVSYAPQKLIKSNLKHIHLYANNFQIQPNNNTKLSQRLFFSCKNIKHSSKLLLFCMLQNQNLVICICQNYFSQVNTMYLSLGLNFPRTCTAKITKPLFNLFSPKALFSLDGKVIHVLSSLLSYL